MISKNATALMCWCTVALVVWLAAPNSVKANIAASSSPRLASSQAGPVAAPSQAQKPPRTAGLRVVVTDAQQNSLAGATCSLIDPREPITIVATAVSNEEG